MGQLITCGDQKILSTGRENLWATMLIKYNKMTCGHRILTTTGREISSPGQGVGCITIQHWSINKQSQKRKYQEIAIKLQSYKDKAKLWIQKL